MADWSGLPLETRLFLKAYRWRRIDPVPCAPLRKPLADATVAVVSTAGLVLPSQQPFDNDVRGGDWSFREIPAGADLSTLTDAHRSASYDHASIESDPNLGLPLERLGGLVRLNRRHFSLMGSITAPSRLMRESAPAVADALVQDGVDAVLLVPV